ncbi:hypothetical protein [Luteimonas notoginsengisoli]|uniref:MarR family transcriptional regulator n=1 Tax=Luteimonas notoginsengisoli TaxID=1578200 RepID=A0ABV7UPX9_9GAMM
MSPLPHIPPLQREALLAALQSPTHTLRRMRGGYVALGADVRTSGTATAHTVTRRMALRLEREGLVDFDDPDYPTVITLNAHGVALAEQLRSQPTKAASR